MSFVWVQLYYEGKDGPEGQPVEIEPITRNVGALKEAAKAKLKKELDHAGLTEITVYPPGTTSFTKPNSIKPGKKLEEVIDELKDTTPPTSDDYPLIVVAPTPQQQPANGKKNQRFGFHN